MIKGNVLITGTSRGIGRACAEMFIKKGYNVIGFDILESSIIDKNYTHYRLNIFKDNLPNLNNINILINNAGVQNSVDDVDINLKGTIRITEKYAINNKGIKSILFNISSSAHTGFEFPRYVASKAGLLGYMKWCACKIAKDYKATCNSISLGGVYTSLNDNVINNIDKWNKIMNVTPLKKWATVERVAQWVYFLTVINEDMTGQDVLIDNGERDLNNTFIW